MLEILSHQNLGSGLVCLHILYCQQWHCQHCYFFAVTIICMCTYIYICVCVYKVSQEECARLRESVPYVKVYRYNPKHLYPKLNGYGDNGQRTVGASCGSKYSNLHSWYVTWQCERSWQWNALFTVPAWRFAQSAMLVTAGLSHVWCL